MSVPDNPICPVADGPALALWQPDQPSSTLADSSYLRLGAYMESDATGRSEKAIITQLSTTTATAPDDHGILLHTSHDLQENVLGAGRMKYGQGHVIDVPAGNASYRVGEGRYDIHAKHGIYLSAGEGGERATFEVTPAGHVLQVATGNENRITEGETTVVSTGDAKRFFQDSLSTRILGESFNFTAGSWTNAVGGTAQHIYLGLSLLVHAVGWLDFRLGYTRKIVIGRYYARYSYDAKQSYKLASRVDIFGNKTQNIGFRHRIDMHNYTNNSNEFEMKTQATANFTGGTITTTSLSDDEMTTTGQYGEQTRNHTMLVLGLKEDFAASRTIIGEREHMRFHAAAIRKLCEVRTIGSRILHSEIYAIG